MLAGGVYLLLLLASTLVRWSDDGRGPAQPDHQWVELPALDATGRILPDQEVAMAFREIPAASPDAPTVLLLHGSPMAGESFNSLAMVLAGDYHLLIPDLPGLGASTRQVPDYAVAAHAHYLAHWLDDRQLHDLHVVAYSMSGGVALHLEALRPGTTRSLTMLSAIGVQEYELFGSYRLNHGVHAAQCALLWVGQNLTPHFGAWDDFLLNTSYARNFLDTDQRPLRSLLRRWSPPMLILHGEGDNLVPIQAAREHARLVPQAQLTEVDGGHIFLFQEPGMTAALLTDFWDAVANGTALTRTETPLETQLAALQPHERDPSWQYMGVALALIFLLLMVATFVSEDLACIGAGLIAAQGLIPLPAAIAACFLGIFIGDNLLYLAGRLLGPQALRRRPLCWVVSATAVARAESWFHQRGPLVIILTRFIPGSRTATYFAAGALRAPYGMFLLFFGVAAAIWTPILVTAASVLGRQLLDWYEAYAALALPIFLAAGLLLYALLHYGLPLLTWRGRRLLLSKWRRAVRWEFWPLWQVQTPVVLFVLWQSLIKYRSLTLLTVTNPGMRHSGFIGESKSEILAALRGAGEAIAPWVLLAASDDLTTKEVALSRFAETHGYPLVLKPDAGQRGLGVVIAKGAEQAHATLAAHPQVAWIAQAFVAGPEFGVFYARRPHEATGRIISLTTKQPTIVTGDGVLTLEQCILADDRAVCMAPFFLEAHAARLDDVPGAGESVALTELGTHCRGAQFFDGVAHITPELTQAVDTIAQAWQPVDGFFFGRFDLKAPSVAHLERGEGLRVLELNGITSESTHIYDPQHGARHGWRTLCRQWALALEIAAANRAAGHQPARLFPFLREVRAVSQQQAKMG